MTAKEMFEELGFDSYCDTYTLNYCNDKRDGWINFTFDLRNKTFEWCSDRPLLYIDTKMFKAILEQVKELKWLDDIDSATLNDLGYDKTDLSTLIYYQKVDGTVLKSIRFIHSSKTFACEVDLRHMTIEPKLFKAIYKQYEELGWLE